MTDQIKRLSDNSILTYGSDTQLLAARDLFSFTRENVLKSGELGETAPIASMIQQKTFELVFVSGDISGNDQKRIQRFFREAGWYELESDSLTLESTVAIRFLVAAIDASTDSDQISITCIAQYGDFTETTVTTVFEQSYPVGGTFAGYSGVVSSPAGGTLRVTVETTAGDVATWSNSISVTMSSVYGSVTAAMGKLGTSGTLEEWDGTNWILDSYGEILSGSGVISPLSGTRFWRYPLTSITTEVTGFTAPVDTDFTVRIEVVKTSQHGDWEV